VIVIIAAMSENRVIGREGDLPWRLPNDLRRFKSLTRGHAVVMGRRTFDSIGGVPLPDRTCFVITRNEQLAAEGVEISRDLPTALERAADVEPDGPVFVLGGGEIYRAAMDRADRLELTVVHAEIEGDTTFPEFDERAWRLVYDERHEPDERHAHAFSFRTYERARTEE
jgi:dihydrofolate reductase